MPVIRDAIAADMPAIMDIYNALIPTTTVAWTEETESLADRQTWFAKQQQNGFPILLAVDDESGDVTGFASYGHFRGAGIWPGYRFTIEHTIHIRQPFWKTGIGRLLMTELIGRAESMGFHVMVGALDGDNDASQAFHQKLGFTEVARMPEVGFKFGRWLDLVLVQRILAPTKTQPEQPLSPA